MTDESETTPDLADWLITREAVSNESASGLANACIGVIDRQYRHLGVYIGGEGFAALLGRALYLARADYPFLDGVGVGSLVQGEPPSGLHAAIREREASLVRAGVVAILAHFIALLATFIGDDFAERLIREAWSNDGPPPK